MYLSTFFFFFSCSIVFSLVFYFLLKEELIYHDSGVHHFDVHLYIIIYSFLFIQWFRYVCVYVYIFFVRVFSNTGYYKILNRVLKNSTSFTFLFGRSYYSYKKHVKTNSLFDQIKRVRLIKNDDTHFCSYSFLLFSHPSLSPKWNNPIFLFFSLIF